MAIDSIAVQATTAPGVNPVVPDAAGLITVNGAAVTNHSVVLETRSRAANAYNLEVQYATTSAATDATKSGVAHFDSAAFTVDANGFVTLLGGTEAIDSIGVDATSGGGTNPVLPTAAGLVTVNGARVAAGTNPIRSVSTAANVYQIQVQTSQAIAATDATKVGLANFDSAKFTVDANGFVSTSGTGVGNTITGDSGGALSPTSGNWNIFGSHGINTSGAVSTLTVAINNAITLGDLSAIAAGSNALSATTGDINVASGNLKLPNTSATGPVGLLKIGTTNFLSNLGTSNAFGGGAANLTLTTGSATNNTAFGNSCFTAVTTASQNCAFGNGALNTMQTGGFNCAFGINALNVQNGTSQSSAFGNRALSAMTTGHDNTAVGSTALTSLLTGDSNVAVGQNAGSAYTSSESNNICIGRGVTGTVSESAVTRIGAAQTACFIDGIDGVNVGSVATVVTESGDKLGTAVITAGTGITVTAGANTITITATTGGFTWNDVSGAFSPLKENGYFITGTATGTLPASPAQGDTIKFFVDHASQLLTIQAAGSQIIRMGSLVSSAGGTAVSTLQGDSCELVYRASNTCWCAISGFTGTWTIA